MELQISYSICTEVPEESVFWRETAGNRSDIKETVRMEESKYSVSGDMSRSCTHVGGDTAKDQRIELYGIPEREKQYDTV